MKKKFIVSTQDRYQLIDITGRVENIIKESNIKEGLVVVFVPHSTAAVLITENESGLKQDWLQFFQDLVSGFDFAHNKIDDNADSHLLSGLIGQSKTLPIHDQALVRGTWQQIFLVELDGPRSTRKVKAKIIEE